MRVPSIISILIVVIVFLVPLGAEEPTQTESPEPRMPQNYCDLSEIKESISEHSRELSKEIRQIKREIALLRQSTERPGIKEIFAGIGYIFGLCGVAFYFSSRRRREG
ncbi:MAG: hypothetical protein N2260_05470 [Syntrophobacterales bacterium]|nr:hypothetical protein [Syntrophobacterales bacterium]